MSAQDLLAPAAPPAAGSRVPAPASSAAVIDEAATAGRSTLVGYLPCGFPDVPASVDAVRAMVAGGVDVVELGMPYSDPVMDGPVIQRAADAALRAGVRVRDVLASVQALRAGADAEGSGAPVLVMSYWAPVDAYGVDAFARDLASAGGAGLITPDLVPDEASAWLAASDEHGLERVFLVAPSSTDDRLVSTAAACRGWTYAASTMGVTGVRGEVGAGAERLVARTRAAGAQRVCVGLGVSTAAQAAEVAAYADGVIVGSALVRALTSGGPSPLGALAAELSDGVRSARRATTTRETRPRSAAVLASIPSPPLSWQSFSLGPLTLHVYALCIIAGIVVATAITERRWVARGGLSGQVLDVVLWMVPFGIVGGRLYHVVSSPEAYFGADGDPIRALYVWNGGLGIWGAVAFGALGAWIGCRRAGMRFAPFADAVAPGLLVAQGIGRLGNWFNQELFGRPTSLPWGLRIDPAFRPAGFETETTFQPTFLYEMLWVFAAAAVLVWWDRRTRQGHGRVFWGYVVLYTLGRVWIETLRIDPAEQVLGLRLNVWTSLAVLALGLVGLTVARRGRESQVLTDAALAAAREDAGEGPAGGGPAGEGSTASSTDGDAPPAATGGAASGGGTSSGARAATDGGRAATDGGRAATDGGPDARCTRATPGAMTQITRGRAPEGRPPRSGGVDFPRASPDRAARTHDTRATTREDGPREPPRPALPAPGTAVLLAAGRPGPVPRLRRARRVRGGDGGHPARLARARRGRPRADRAAQPRPPRRGRRRGRHR